MAITLAEAVLKLTLDRAELTRGLKDAEQEGRRGAGTIGDVMTRELQRRFNPGVIFQRFQAGLDSLAKNATRAGTALSVGLSLPLLLVGGRLIKLATDTVETENLFTVSMGRMAAAATAWSKSLRASLGLNEFELRRMVAVFNNMLTSMGLGPQAAFDMSRALVELTFDMASFFNIQPAAAFEKLQSGIVGQARSLLELGIIVNETTIKQYALNRGLIQEGQELSETGKIMARFGVIIEATKNAQGSLARSLDSPANKLRIMREQANQAAVELGLALLPAFQALLSDAKPFIAALGDIAKRFAALDPHTRALILRLGLMAITIGPVLVGIGKLAGAFSALIGFAPKIGAFAGSIIGWLAGIGGGATAAAGRVARLAAALKGLGVISIPVAAAFVPFTNVAAARQKLLDIAKQDARFAGLAKGLLAAPEFNVAQANQVIQAWERIRRAKADDALATQDAATANIDYQRTLAEIEKAAAAAAAKAGGGAKGTNVALQQALRLFDLVTERDRLSTAEQIVGLERIRDKFARTADERMDFELRLARLRNQLADEEDARLEKPRKTAEARYEAEAKMIDDVLARLKEVADAGDVPGVIRLLDQWKNRLPEIARGYIGIAEAAKKSNDEAIAAAVAIVGAEIARPERAPSRAEGLIEAAQQRLWELGTARVRNIDLIQREISQLEIIVEQEAKREEQLADQEQIAEARLNRLYAEAEIQGRLLEIARLRVDDARAILDLTQLEHSLGLATAAQVDDARRQALAALQAQLATARGLNATQAELIPILQDILRIQEDLIRGDFLASWLQAIREVKAQTFDFLSSARQFFSDLTQGFASALRGFALEGKTILETLGNLARAVFDAAFTQITNNLAQKLTQVVSGFLGRLIPGLGGAAAPDAGLTTAAAITTSGTAAAAAITTSGISAATAITTSGVSVATAIATASAAMAAAIIAAGAAAAAAIAAAVGAGAGIGAVFGMQHGGVVTRPMLATIAEAGRPEIVLPIPRGLSLREMANTMRAVAAGTGQTVNIYNPVVRSDDDIRRIGRSVADAMRMARRGNHPVWREGR
jgi:hypothetical protein